MSISEDNSFYLEMVKIDRRLKCRTFTATFCLFGKNFVVYTFEFFPNHQNTKLTDLAITSYLVFPILNLLQSLINLLEYATQKSN